MTLEVRKMNTQQAYRISNGERFVIIDNSRVNLMGYEEYGNSNSIYPLLDSMDIVDVGDSFNRLIDVPRLPDGSLVIWNQRVLIRSNLGWVDLETGRQMHQADNVSVLRIGR